MKKLNRNLAQKPSCLQAFVHNKHNWANMNSAKKKQVWKELDKFQEKICVYCESAAFRGKDTGHIEHFFDKSTHIERTFEWDNLFGCCMSNTHCGHFKDQKLSDGTKRQYNPQLLIKPDVEDPELYLQFLPSGKVKEKDDLTEACMHKANETIKALNLNESSLKRKRESHIARFQERVVAIIQIIEDSTDNQEVNRAMIEYRNIQRESITTIYKTAVKQAVSWI